MEFSFHINNIDKKKDILNVNRIEKLENGDKYYDEKIVEYIHNLSDSKLILEITKFCGYSHLMVVSKEDSLLDLYIDISKQMWCNNILGLFAMIKKNDNGSLSIKKMPLSTNITLNEFILKNKSRPIYSVQKPCVYRVFIDVGPKEKSESDSDSDSDSNSD